jgi:hypothetical protein
LSYSCTLNSARKKKIMSINTKIRTHEYLIILKLKEPKLISCNHLYSGYKDTGSISCKKCHQLTYISMF